MKKFKLSALLIFAALFVFSACGGGGGGGSDDPKDPGNPGDNSGDDPKNPKDDPKDLDDDPVLTYALPGGTVFKMIMTPDIATDNKFPTITDDKGSAYVPERFVMSETEVTYQLWKEVYDWATSPDRGALKYTFINAGREGSDGIDGAAPTETSKNEPVTQIEWWDSIVWCNALTEYYNTYNGSEPDLECVYTHSYETIRDSSDSNVTYLKGAVKNSSAKGFRLPMSREWEYAARYIGITKPSHENYILKDGIYYTKGNSASGAIADCSNVYATIVVAVYNVSRTAVVKSKGVGSANALGFFDMSGNVEEWCYSPYILNRDKRGGSYNCSADYVSVGLEFDNISPNSVSNDCGFRVSRNK